MAVKLNSTFMHIATATGVVRLTYPLSAVSLGAVVAVRTIFQLTKAAGEVLLRPS